jgi:peptidyl-prolyl cis-trans isomerase D
MAKKRQTTGAPKAKPKNAETTSGKETRAQASDREYRSRAEREAMIQRWLVRITAGAAILILVLIVIAFMLDRVIIPNQVVATVNGENITVGQFQARVRLERSILNQRINGVIANYLAMGGTEEQIGQLFQQEPYKTWADEITISDQLGLRVLNDMIDEQLIRAEAENQSITVTQDDIQAQIDSFFGFDPQTVAALDVEPTATVEPSPSPTPFVSPTPSSTPTITPTPEVEETEEPTVTPFPTIPPEPTLSSTEIVERYETNVDGFFNGIRRETGLSEADIESYFEARALRLLVSESLDPENTTANALHADVRHILVNTEEEALDIMAALEAGESFADLARAASQDTGSGRSGGELGWATLSQYVAPFAEAVETAPIGEISGPVQSDFGYHIIQVRAREEREIDDAQLENAKERTVSLWLEDQNSAEDSSIERFSIWTSYVPTDPAFVRTAGQPTQ